VEIVAGGEHRKGGEVQLECANARQRPGRGADLGRKVGQRREVVAGERGLGRELRTGDLHAVAGVTREADDDGVAVLDRLGTRGYPVRHLGTPPRPPWALNLLRVFAQLASKTRTRGVDSLRPGRLQLGRPRGACSADSPHGLGLWFPLLGVVSDDEGDACTRPDAVGAVLALRDVKEDRLAVSLAQGAESFL